MTNRVRIFVFTLNNYTPAQELHLKSLECQYMLFGHEVAPSTGTPHLQGMVAFVHNKTFSAVKSLFKCPSVHLEQCRDIDASIEYCKKDNHFFEKGTPPLSSKAKGKKEELRWAEIIVNAKAGNWDAIDPRVQLTQARNIDFIYNRALSERPLSDTNYKMFWFHGKPGTGKSRAVRERYPNCYLKMCNRWWDAYRDEDVVLIEDFDAVAHTGLCHLMKIWLDRYPFLGEVKGGSRKMRPKLIVVTSNYHPNEIWFTAGQLDPILRRVDCIDFDNTNAADSIDWPVFQAPLQQLPPPPPPPDTPATVNLASPDMNWSDIDLDQDTDGSQFDDSSLADYTQDSILDLSFLN